MFQSINTVNSLNICYFIFPQLGGGGKKRQEKKVIYDGSQLNLGSVMGRKQNLQEKSENPYE